MVRDRLWRLLRWAVLAAIGWFVIRVATTALDQAIHHDDFSDTLQFKLESLPVLFPIHMAAGGLALLLVPLAYALRRRPRWHRPIGLLTALLVLSAGLTAYPVAWTGPVTRWSAAGFMAQASVWLTFLGLGLWHIAHGRRAQHRRAMLMMAAATSGAVFFRLWLALWAILGERRHFVVFYSIDAWFAWLVPLIVMAIVLNRAGPLPANPR